MSSAFLSSERCGPGCSQSVSFVLKRLIKWRTRPSKVLLKRTLLGPMRPLKYCSYSLRFFQFTFTVGNLCKASILSYVGLSLFKIGRIFFVKLTHSSGSINFSVSSLRCPAQDGRLATMKGVKPLEDLHKELAPALMRASTARSTPLKTAWCSGDQPSMSWRSTSPLLETSSGMSSTSPFRAAMCNADRPFMFCMLTLTCLPLPSA
mmetsp:Transcript_14327/g.27154  ORF Transcript_14327/g.27154 Transcript_14327/m.27154 type:complete len:206 (+) Transcript_14327:385-1002(+)